MCLSCVVVVLFELLHFFFLIFMIKMFNVIAWNCRGPGAYDVIVKEDSNGQNT